MKYRFIIIAAAMLTAATGCNKDFLNIKDPDAIPAAELGKSTQDISLMLNNAYAMTRTAGLYGAFLFPKGTYPLGHITDQQWRNDAWWNELHQNNTKPQCGDFASVYSDAWRGVAACNVVLEALQNFRANYMKPDEKNVTDQIEGQALGLRALYYFFLVNLWGDGMGKANFDKPGVPIVTNIPRKQEELYVERAKVGEVWDFMIDDLEKAETLLDGFTDIRRVNKWSVKAFLGKAYVFTENWTEARAKLLEVIENSGRQLLPLNDYKQMFNGKKKFNNESLFELNSEVDFTAGWGVFGGPTTGATMGLYYGLEGYGFDNLFMHDRNLARFGFTLPIPTLTADEKNINDPAYLTQSLQLRQGNAVDPRLYICALEPYIDKVGDDVNAPKTIVPQYVKPGERTQYHAWLLRKYGPIDHPIWSFNGQINDNFYFIRLADVYLLFAEACKNTGDNVNALEYINKVKRRAYGYPVNGASPADYPSLTAGTMAKGTDKHGAPDQLANDPLKYERWAELFGEGHWWFDVCRWRIGSKEADYFVRVTTGEIQWNDNRSYAQPIPIQEMQVNPKMVQNPNY
ncbi:RagB/SusD family nutrient uptake outer membrane protein [Chitinophaga barathri]|uniref:RagB/SusD family nutrient uptake outer membrane protein n=1 Tax=Chitinophaga barathri TaxID=1647451 RepID=A0A3N4MG75_9BACT|nr:RagB/SusD family nutrient uptake outer membrane protein [Chitinophaga barathri]RPD43032.1 RagB/SusD family nutrient uptake outer membrane protein [Chitinophaga barathri]